MNFWPFRKRNDSVSFEELYFELRKLLNQNQVGLVVLKKLTNPIKGFENSVIYILNAKKYDLVNDKDWITLETLSETDDTTIEADNRCLGKILKTRSGIYHALRIVHTQNTLNLVGRTFEVKAENIEDVSKTIIGFLFS